MFTIKGISDKEQKGVICESILRALPSWFGLDESRESKSYEKTRLFYLAMGFKPLEVFKTLWDEDNPCLFMVKHIQS